MIPQYCIAHSYCTEFYIISTHMNKTAAFFYTALLLRETNRRFLVNKHGDLYFFIVQFWCKNVLFELDNLKKQIHRREKRFS